MEPPQENHQTRNLRSTENGQLKPDTALEKNHKAFAGLTPNETKEAISEGVERAFWRLFTGITDMPSADFWATLEKSIEQAFKNIAEEKADKKA